MDLPFTSDELMQKGSKVWKHLDALAASDPQAYQQFIKSVTEQAQNPQSTSHIKPGFFVQTTESTDASSLARTFFVNIAQTEKIPSPPADDPLNIPVCISEIRTCDDKRSKVVDAVVNSKVIEKCSKDSFFKSDLINLAMDCIKETHSVTLVKRTNKITDNEYKGPFGWDAKGQPLSDEQIRQMSDIKVVPASAEEPEVSIKVPGKDLASNDKKHPAPVIEVIEVEGAATPAAWTRKDTETHAIFYCRLPGVVDQGGVDISVVADKGAVVRAGGHSLELPIDKDIDPQCSAKFIRTTETLKLKFKKAHVAKDAKS
ncbi:PIH1 domain-containing protein 2 [Chytriomyces hyalinus]|nr:PIH1 domain-containing protein 2 [Chytriomyces hyalinus]